MTSRQRYGVHVLPNQRAIQSRLERVSDDVSLTKFYLKVATALSNKTVTSEDFLEVWYAELSKLSGNAFEFVSINFTPYAKQLFWNSNPYFCQIVLSAYVQPEEVQVIGDNLTDEEALAAKEAYKKGFNKGLQRVEQDTAENDLPPLTEEEVAEEVEHSGVSPEALAELLGVEVVYDEPAQDEPVEEEVAPEPQPEVEAVVEPARETQDLPEIPGEEAKLVELRDFAAKYNINIDNLRLKAEIREAIIKAMS